MATFELLGLAPLDGERTSFVLREPLVRFDRQLFGGTGLAAVVEVMELATGRDALWATVQFVDSAAEGERIDVVAESVATGGTTSQVRVTATTDGRLVFAGLGSTARARSDGFEATFGTMPTVTPPEDCPPLTFGMFDPPPDMRQRGPFAIGDYRVAPGSGDTHHVWVHLHDMAFSRSALAYVADFIPSSVLRAAGRVGGGTSLDNAVRFGPPVPERCDWVLLETDPYFAHNGFVHGAARLWADDGTLLGVATQSAVARLFD